MGAHSSAISRSIYPIGRAAICAKLLTLEEFSIVSHPSKASLEGLEVFVKTVRAVCLFFSGRLKGDVRHLVFFVHQEYGSIALG